METVNNNIQFSVIVCCYNPNLDLLKKTIFSILNQKDVTYEVIITDDGSKLDYEDEIRNWCSQFSDKIIKFNFIKKNGGTIKNIISAMEIAQGRYVKPISPGDYLFDEYSLKEFLNGFENDKNDIVFSDAVYYCENQIVKNQYPVNKLVYHSKTLKKNYCIYGDFFLGATICAKKEVEMDILNRVKDKVLYLEDYSLMTIAFMDNLKVHGIKKPLMWYEFGTGISTKTHRSPLIDKDSISVHNYLKENYQGEKIVDKMIERSQICELPIYKKALKLMLKYPYYYIHKLLNHVYGPKKYNVSIDKMNYITERNF